MERTSGEEYFNETIVSKRTSLWKRYGMFQPRAAREDRQGQGAIRTDIQQTTPLIEGVAYSVTYW